MSVAINIDQVIKRYGKLTIIPGLTEHIRNGEFFTLLGPSGCGKTTLLRMIAGFNTIEGGKIRFNDQVINDIPAHKRNIGMVFQSYAIFPHMTVRENVEYGLKLRKMPKAEMKEKVDKILDVVQITEYQDRLPERLSGGQQQRVALARAIVIHPSVLLMDEPLSNLDAKLRNQMRAEIIKLRQKIDTTFMYVTHDQTEAMTLGDRIVVMKDGEVQQIGTPQEVFETPANLFVAGFIGVPQMNFFDADLVRSGADYAVKLGDVTIKVPKDKAANLASHDVQSQTITLGVRPEHLTLGVTDGPRLEGTVDVSEMMGSTVHLHMTSLGQDVIAVVNMMEEGNGHAASYRLGDKVEYTFPTSVIHMFSKETSKNLEL